MIICNNCGTTNNEAVTRTCRKCGALLPVKTTRKKPPKPDKKEKKSQKTTQRKRKKPDEKLEEKSAKLDLQEIPKEEIEISKPVELEEIPIVQEEEGEIKETIEPHHEQGPMIKQDKPDVLQEITPQPFKGSIITPSQKAISPPPRSNDVVTDAFKELKDSVLEGEEKKPGVPLTPITSKTVDEESAIIKQKRLEKDMTEVLGFLSKKISVKKLDIPKPKSIAKKEPKEKIPPTSMNEILKELIQLDSNIEASAIIKKDGTILASAISNRISDSLFATIGMNLSMIGTDIIDGLSAGTLKSISIRGSEGVLDLAPIDKKSPNLKDMVLMLLSQTKIKSGIISFAVHVVKKQLKQYLGLKKE